MAVADGHGSKKCCRSDTGSEIAVSVAIDACRAIVSDGSLDLTSIKRQLEDFSLAKRIVVGWRERVTEHCTANQFSSDELAMMNPQSVDYAREPWAAYGTTLLVVVITNRYTFCMQLGDGDIVYIDWNGHVSRQLESDSRLIANETTSLSGSQSPWFDFRTSFQTIEGSPPAMVLLATDGYSNSFQDDAGFLKVSSDTLNMILEHGFEVVRDSTEGWLRDISQDGSGDDISVGVAFRSSPRPRPVAPPHDQGDPLASHDAFRVIDPAIATDRADPSSQLDPQDKGPTDGTEEEPPSLDVGG